MGCRFSWVYPKPHSFILPGTAPIQLTLYILPTIKSVLADCETETSPSHTPPPPSSSSHLGILAHPTKPFRVFLQEEGSTHLPAQRDRMGGWSRSDMICVWYNRMWCSNLYTVVAALCVALCWNSVIQFGTSLDRGLRLLPVQLGYWDVLRERRGVEWGSVCVCVREREVFLLCVK